MLLILTIMSFCNLRRPNSLYVFSNLIWEIPFTSFSLSTFIFFLPLLFVSIIILPFVLAFTSQFIFAFRHLHSVYCLFNFSCFVCVSFLSASHTIFVSTVSQLHCYSLLSLPNSAFIHISSYGSLSVSPFLCLLSVTFSVVLLTFFFLFSSPSASFLMHLFYSILSHLNVSLFPLLRRLSLYLSIYRFQLNRFSLFCLPVCLSCWGLGISCRGINCRGTTCRGTKLRRNY